MGGSSLQSAFPLLVSPHAGKGPPSEPALLNKTTNNMNPDDLAVMIAALIDRDPAMAAKIKEHIKPERLKVLLGLDQPDNQTELPLPVETR